MIEIRKLTPDLLDAYLDFFDNRAFSDGSPNGPCYCTAFSMSAARIREELFLPAQRNGGGPAEWRKAQRNCAVRMVQGGEIQGYLAFEHGIPVGWCNVNDRLRYARVGAFDLTDGLADEPCPDRLAEGEIKSVVCFEIAPGARGRGVASMLLEKACADARAEGYAFIEAYPESGEPSPARAFTGPRRLYEKAGFTVTAQKGGMLVMRKRLRRLVAACGNDCAACPRYTAHLYEKSEEQLRRTAELWFMIGYRDRVVSPEELACPGCRKENRCRYDVVGCCFGKGIGSCAACAQYPCERMKACFSVTESFEPKCREACTPDEYRQLKEAFFEKEQNLALLRKDAEPHP